MKKSHTSYYAHNAKTMYILEVKVNEDVDFSHMRCRYDRGWKSKEDTIKYLQWCIKQIEGLEC